jgi:hypothetical protein
MDTLGTSTLLTVGTLHVHTANGGHPARPPLLTVDTLHVHTADGGHPARPHCWRWAHCRQLRVIHPACGVDGYNRRIWWWKGVHPQVHTCQWNGYIFTSTLLALKIDTPARPHFLRCRWIHHTSTRFTAGGEKGYILHVNSADSREGLTLHVHLLNHVEKLVVNAGEKDIAALTYWPLQCGIGIRASGSVRYRWLRTSPTFIKRVFAESQKTSKDSPKLSAIYNIV